MSTSDLFFSKGSLTSKQMKVKAFSFSLFLVPALVAAAWYPKSLPCEVTVVSNGTEVSVNCTQVGLEYVPSGIPRNTTNLTLTINRIPHINTTSFEGLENITEIDMRCNCVPVKVGPKNHVCNQRVTIETGSFRHLKTLKSLYLDGNQLTSIPLRLPKGLVLLSLEVNNIVSILRKNLTELTHIETLYLGQNCYFRNPCNESYKVEEDAFLQMERMTLLSLKANNLSTIPQRLPSSLKELYLYNNNIQKVTKEDFQNLTNLQILDLSGNCPRCYNAPYPCAPCPNNAPLQIEDKAFKNLNKLQILRLHSNSLTTVDPRWFQGCKNLKVLDLSSNYLSREISVARFPTSLPKLEELDLSFNYELQKYPASLNLNESFSDLKSLQILRLRGLVFQELTEKDIYPLVSLKNLRMIDLGFNFIKITDLSNLAKLKHVSIINLSENKISTPTENAVSSIGSVGQSLNKNPVLHNTQYYNREVREIHYFRFDEFARSCKHKDKELGVVRPLNTECTQRGKTLDISRNNIFFLHSSFLNLSDLKCLNLSGNAMSQSLNGSEFVHLQNLEYLDFSSNRLDTMYSTAFQELNNLVVLDISYNNHYFEAEGLTHMLNFTKNLRYLKKLLMNYNKISTSTNTEMRSFSLEHLEFKGNRLDMLWRDGDTRYTKYFKELLGLKKLYLSENNLNFIPENLLPNLPETLTELHINTNKLTTFPWDKLAYLKQLEVLDLSENLLTDVPKTLSNYVSLKELILWKNNIAVITPLFLANITTLRVLDLSYNDIQHIDQSSFPEDSVKKLDTLYLNNNKFLCTCRAIWFVMWLNRTSVNIPKLATDVKCAAPGEQEGKMVISLYLPACQENSISIILYILLTSLTLAFIALPISSHLFLWDVWYIYHFVSAKLKGYKRMVSDSTFYDAFIVYDRKDGAVSEWVMQELRVHLEDQGDPALQLCLDERDWVPGCPLIDNLSQSIQQSKRTVFILTNGYMKSGDFKTAFYLAHQRLMDEKNDVIVLIFLEKIPCNSKYLRLRRRLYKRSVLEWPSNPQAQQYFWYCLRSVMVTESQKHYSKLFQETL